MSTSFPEVTVEQWRAEAEKGLNGVSFEKALVSRSAEGLPVQPLYTSAPALVVPGMPAEFLIAPVLREGAEGDEAVWVHVSPNRPTRFLIIDGKLRPDLDRGTKFVLNHSPLAGEFLDEAKQVDANFPNGVAGMISTLRQHDAGADAIDELAITLATGAQALEALLQAGLPVERAVRQLAVQIAVGRDTFGELAKLRALRIVWDKVTTAAGAPATKLLVHAVCSRRTLTQRDPWVNMLRCTTQMFAAILGGADLITPTAFDEDLGPASALGQRVAVNTGLVLRHESFLGRVIDPAAGSYYLDQYTDALAREAWKRFQGIQAAGGVVMAHTKIEQRIAASWQARLENFAKRRTPILGVSEFANLEEQLPAPAKAATGPAHREAEAFEQLRLRADAKQPRAILHTIGTLAETRARVGFATNFFAAGGIRTKETDAPEKAVVACLCGTDEAYAAHAATRAQALKAAGCTRVLIAGRPGANEAELRAAGVDGFIFMGCDLIASLNELLDVYP